MYLCEIVQLMSILFLLNKKKIQFWLHLLTHWTLNAQRVPNLVWNSSLNHTSNTQTDIHANIWFSSRRIHYTCMETWKSQHHHIKEGIMAKNSLYNVESQWLVTFHKLCSLFHSFVENCTRHKAHTHTFVYKHETRMFSVIIIQH